MPVYPEFRTKPYYTPLKTWLQTALNEDGTLRESAVLAVAAAKGATEAQLATLTFDVYDPNDYGAVRSVSDPGTTVKTANTAAINAAANDARDNLGVLQIRGDYWINGTIGVESHVDGRSGTLRVSQTTLNPVVRVGSPTSGVQLTDKVIVLPNVLGTGKAALGNGVWGSDVGVEFRNLNSCHLTTRKIEGFGTNMVVSSLGTGNAYNEYHWGHSDNGKVGLRITPGTGGWTNENNFYGGRFSIDSGEGSAIAGSRHIQITSNGVNPANNLRFLKPSIEANGPEFHVDLEDTFDIVIDQARWEASPPKIRIDTAVNTEVRGGYNADAIVWTVVGTNTYQKVLARTQWWAQFGSADGGIILQNQGSGAFPVLTVLDTNATFSTDPTTAYRTRITPAEVGFKGTADAFPRINIDTALGRIEGGNGTVDPNGNYLRPLAAIGWQTQNKMLATGGLGVGNSVLAGGPVGTLVRKMEVFDANGTSIGFIPIYSAIT